MQMIADAVESGFDGYDLGWLLERVGGLRAACGQADEFARRDQFGAGEVDVNWLRC